jgi:hypothetical protein
MVATLRVSFLANMALVNGSPNKAVGQRQNDVHARFSSGQSVALSADVAGQ